MDSKRDNIVVLMSKHHAESSIHRAISIQWDNHKLDTKDPVLRTLKASKTMLDRSRIKLCHPKSWSKGNAVQSDQSEIGWSI